MLIEARRRLPEIASTRTGGFARGGNQPSGFSNPARYASSPQAEGGKARLQLAVQGPEEAAQRAAEAQKPRQTVEQGPAKTANRRLGDADSGIESAPVLDDAAMFRQAVDGVRRLGDQRPVRVVPKPEVTLEIVSEDAEVLAQLSDLVSGVGTFELTETEEYTEGTRLGLDPRLVTRLRRGEFAVQAHIDLHGMIQADAKLALEEFIVGSVRKGLRTVLVVHGRGLRSPGGMPVLKHAAAQWLSHGHMGGYVLAFATARPADGGAGAMYVLLQARSPSRPLRRPARRQTPRLSGGPLTGAPTSERRIL